MTSYSSVVTYVDHAKQGDVFPEIFSSSSVNRLLVQCVKPSHVRQIMIYLHTPIYLSTVDHLPLSSPAVVVRGCAGSAYTVKN